MIAAALLLAAQAAAAATPPAAAKPAAEKMRCQLIYQARSRIPDRLCLTQSEWDKIAKENNDDLASSRNARSSGRSGTIANDAEGGITRPTIPHAKGPGPY
jgi:hypothetical protein